MAAKPRKNVPNIQKDGPPRESPLPPAKVIENPPSTGTLEQAVEQARRAAEQGNSQ